MFRESQSVHCRDYVSHSCFHLRLANKIHNVTTNSRINITLYNSNINYDYRNSGISKKKIKIAISK